MKDVNIILGSNIKAFRKINGLTQEQLADRLGVTYQAISKWENGRSIPDSSLLPDIVRVFGCRIDDLFAKKQKTVS